MSSCFLCVNGLMSSYRVGARHGNNTLGFRRHNIWIIIVPQSKRSLKLSRYGLNEAAITIWISNSTPTMWLYNIRLPHLVRQPHPMRETDLARLPHLVMRDSLKCKAASTCEAAVSCEAALSTLPSLGVRLFLWGSLNIWDSLILLGNLILGVSQQESSSFLPCFARQ